MPVLWVLGDVGLVLQDVASTDRFRPRSLFLSLTVSRSPSVISLSAPMYLLSPPPRTLTDPSTKIICPIVSEAKPRLAAAVNLQ